MKKIFTIFCISLLLYSCEKGGQNPSSGDNWEEMISSVNGELLTSYDKAYTEYERYHAMPSSIKWNAMELNAGTYLRLGVSFMVRILDNPNSWHKVEMDYEDFSPIAYLSIEPFVPDSADFKDFEKLIREQNVKLLDSGDIDNEFLLGDAPGKLTRQGLNAMLCRSLSHYYRNHSFPTRVSTAEGSYIHATSNCEVFAPEVELARNEAWSKAGVTESSTVRQKAEAIFIYGRDVWDYEGYNDTRKGAVGTIKAKAANCCDMSHAICAMARLSGIPSRYFHAQCKYSSGRIGHVISQLYVDGVWEFADATNNSNTFGKVSFTDPQNIHYYESLPF